MQMAKTFEVGASENIGGPPAGWYYQRDLQPPIGPYATRDAAGLALRENIETYGPDNSHGDSKDTIDKRLQRWIGIAQKHSTGFQGHRLYANDWKALLSLLSTLHTERVNR